MALVTPMTQKATAAAPRPNRMALTSIVRGKRPSPYRLLVMGVDGVGKSSFGASAPNPVFLGPELGTNHLDVARFPVPETFEDVIDAIRTLTLDAGGFETLVIDSIDWIEPLVWKWVCEQASVKTIEEVGGGYGKGYVAALDAWRQLLAALERLQRERGLHLVLIAHAFIKPFRNPEGEDFERYVLKLHDKAAALCREWSEGVYFAQFETFAVKEKGKRVKGVSTGARLLYTQRTAAYDAKDRYGVPESLPLDWNEFVSAATSHRPAEPKNLVEAIKAAATELGGELEKRTAGYLADAGDDAEKLSKLSNWVNAKLGAKRQQEGN